MFGPLVRKYAQKIPKSTFAKLAGIWAPFLGAGIKIDRISKDFTEIDIRMPLMWFNKNYVGTQFGGSIYAMVDPFFMLMLIENLGPDYIVWDKSATIEFLRPGTGELRASFRLSREEIEEIRKEVDEKGRIDIHRDVTVTNKSGRAVAKVGKTLFVARKDARKPRRGE